LITNYIAIREHLLSSYPSLFSTRTDSPDPPHLHLTLLTLCIEATSQIEQCKMALKRFQEEIRYNCSYPEPLSLEFHGLDTFYDKVLYVKCKPNQRLEHLRTLIVERFCEEQQKQNLNDVFFAGNYFEFIPHITLLKCKRKFSSIGQNENKEINFGKQMIDSLQLCSIGKNEYEENKNTCVFKLDLN
jgi:2'-5' RNA ligase